MQLRNLTLNHLTGDFHGDGPGWVVSVRRGGQQAFGIPGGPLAGPGRPTAIRPVALGPTSPEPPDPNALTCIHLRFMKSLNGNQIRKDVAFHGQVRAAYAPVPLWTSTLESDDPNILVLQALDPNRPGPQAADPTRLGPQAADPNRPGPQAVVLHSDHLAVNDMSPVSGSSGGNVELTAQDNVIAEGKKVELTAHDVKSIAQDNATTEGKNPTGTHFTVRCARLTYAQAKDMLILEGDGRSDAELYRQEGSEGSLVSRIAAQQFEYFPKTNQVSSVGIHSLDMNQAPGRKP